MSLEFTWIDGFDWDYSPYPTEKVICTADSVSCTIRHRPCNFKSGPALHDSSILSDLLVLKSEQPLSTQFSTNLEEERVPRFGEHSDADGKAILNIYNIH